MPALPKSNADAMEPAMRIAETLASAMLSRTGVEAWQSVDTQDAIAQAAARMSKRIILDLASNQ